MYINFKISKLIFDYWNFALKLLNAIYMVKKKNLWIDILRKYN